MTMTRRNVLAVLAAATAIGTSPGHAAPRRKLPKDFLWGAAISAHQSEGNDINSDSWLLEKLPETVYKEPSGDACDSYRRYEQDFAIARSIGLNCYRFGIEWARIEPAPGRFSQAELDHYVQVLASCRAHGLLPIVTYNHFTVPLWFAMRGGWEVPDSADLFARFNEVEWQAVQNAPRLEHAVIIAIDEISSQDYRNASRADALLAIVSPSRSVRDGIDEGRSIRNKLKWRLVRVEDPCLSISEIVEKFLVVRSVDRMGPDDGRPIDVRVIVNDRIVQRVIPVISNQHQMPAALPL